MDRQIPQVTEANVNMTVNKNPLEIKTAIAFGFLFVIFAFATDYIMKTYGSSGVTSMAFIVGVTDIDPFLLNLLQNTGSITGSTVTLAIINATNSNNLLKMIYAITVSSKSIRRRIILSFSILLISGIAVSLLFYLL